MPSDVTHPRATTQLLHQPCAFAVNFGRCCTRVAANKCAVRMGQDGGRPISRRVVIHALLSLPALLLTGDGHALAAVSGEEGRYDVLKSRRYIDIGPPSPPSDLPGFVSDVPVFSIDDRLQAQDVALGDGPPVTPSALVVARWRARLPDGTVVDESNARRPVLFRPHAHQVPPGIEDSVVGMKRGGHRIISGSAERILT